MTELRLSCMLAAIGVAERDARYGVGALVEGDMTTPVYLDYAATTPVAPTVTDTMIRHLGTDGIFGNPASTTHLPGREAMAAVERARQHVAKLINADPDEIIWTSGATEAINLAIKGIAHARANRGRHIVTSCLEHHAVLDTCSHLVGEGYEVTMLTPDPNGLITTESVRTALRHDTILVSLMHVNNEVGTITDIATIGKLTRRLGITFHVDAAQSTARLPLDVSALHVDLLSLSAHKMYGPKGVGALYVRSSQQTSIAPQMHGGGQEQGLRAGTLPTHQLAAMGEAANLMCDLQDHDVRTVAALDHHLVELLAGIDHMYFNGNQQQRSPGIVNIAFACVDSESLMLALRDEVAISSGSACTSSRVEPSHVLLGLGLPEERADCSVRISFGRFTTHDELEFTADALARDCGCPTDAISRLA